MSVDHLNKKQVREQNVSGNVGAYQTPRAFRYTSAPFLQQVERPKRPSHTKMFDFK